MENNQLIAQLNWFYSLEQSQVKLYTAQSKWFAKRYSGIVFERIALIEQQHVDNIAAKIREIGGTPTFLGDLIAPLFGRLAGNISAQTGLNGVLSLNIALEQKAMQDYNKLISRLRQENPDSAETIRLLQHNFVDEHLHTEWFRNKLIASKQYDFTVKQRNLFGRKYSVSVSDCVAHARAPRRPVKLSKWLDKQAAVRNR